MSGQNRQKPFEICIESKKYPSKGLEGWSIDKTGLRNAFAKKHLPLIAVLLGIALFSLGISLTSERGDDVLRIRHKAQHPFEPISTHALDADAGLVLLDVQTRHAAVSLHVSEPGVYVLSVAKGSPANAAGLFPGDCILQLNGADVKDATEFLSFLNGLGSEESAMIVLRRESDQITIYYKAGQMDIQI